MAGICRGATQFGLGGLDAPIPRGKRFGHPVERRSDAGALITGGAFQRGRQFRERLDEGRLLGVGARGQRDGRRGHAPRNKGLANLHFRSFSFSSSRCGFTTIQLSIAGCLDGSCAAHKKARCSTISPASFYNDLTGS